MTPDKALELVGKYARLTRAIKLQTEWIGANLERCKGIDGKREGFSNLDLDSADGKSRDKRTHLWGWYQPERGEYGQEWQDITAEDYGKECVHCYNAHLAIQLRKQARKDLGVVKGAMSRAIINKD